jgi:hypothetical protein
MDEGFLPVGLAGFDCVVQLFWKIYPKLYKLSKYLISRPFSMFGALCCLPVAAGKPSSEEKVEAAVVARGAACRQTGVTE